MVGTSNLTDVVKIIEDLERGKEYESIISDKPHYYYPEETARQQITVGASSYLKSERGAIINAVTVLFQNLEDLISLDLSKTLLKKPKNLLQKELQKLFLLLKIHLLTA